MEVNCKDCGICCFSPINQVLVQQIQDEDTKNLFEKELLHLIELGIIIDKVARSGNPTKKETEKLMDTGMLHVLSPALTIIHPPTGLKQIIFRLRHLPMIYKMNDGIEVPVFACVFFNPENKTCDLFGRSYRPLHCRIYPFNELQKIEQLRKEGNIPSFVKLSVLCDSWRLKGKITSKQLHEIRSYEAMRKKFSNGAINVQNPDDPKTFFGIRELVTFGNVLPVTDEDIKSIGVTLEDLSLIMDCHIDLPLLVRRVFSRVYGEKRVSVSLPKEQKMFSDYIDKKIVDSIDWWRNLKLDEGTIFEMCTRMQELFYRRMLSHRQKPIFNELEIDGEGLAHLR